VRLTVRLPAEFRFEGAAEVSIRRDESTGDVILAARSPVDWGAFMNLHERLGRVPEDFLTEREQGEQQRDPFEWKVLGAGH
jgi:antitoxin VapB